MAGKEKYYRFFIKFIMAECAMLVIACILIVFGIKGDLVRKNINDRTTDLNVGELETTQATVAISTEEQMDVATEVLNTELKKAELEKNELLQSDPNKEQAVRSNFDYPEVLQTMLENYPETINFYNEYPEKMNKKPVDTIGSIKEGEIPLLIQWDDKWGYSKFGDFVIGTNGCGPTCLAMVLSGLKRDNTITPYKVAMQVEENGFYVEGAGTAWSAMTEIASLYDIEAHEIYLGEAEVFSWLEKGCPIICSVREGDFTKGGHFIVLAGISDGKLIINDPNSPKNSKKLWDYDRVADQISGLWVYEKEGLVDTSTSGYEDEYDNYDSYEYDE